MSPTIEAAKAELVEELGVFDNWMDRYQYIIDLGKQLPQMPNEWKTAQYRISGCQSNVWIHNKFDGSLLHFKATSDAAIVSGLIAIVMRLYNDRSPLEIIDTPADALQSLGLEQHLSPTRRNGLHAILSYIYTVAFKFKF